MHNTHTHTHAEPFDCCTVRGDWEEEEVISGEEELGEGGREAKERAGRG